MALRTPWQDAWRKHPNLNKIEEILHCEKNGVTIADKSKTALDNLPMYAAAMDNIIHGGFSMPIGYLCQWISVFGAFSAYSSPVSHADV